MGFFCCDNICSLYILFHFCLLSVFLALGGLLFFYDFVIDFCYSDRLTSVS
jgi:hypothetical protein